MHIFAWWEEASHTQGAPAGMRSMCHLWNTMVAVWCLGPASAVSEPFLWNLCFKGTWSKQFVLGNKPNSQSLISTNKCLQRRCIWSFYFFNSFLWMYFYCVNPDLPLQWDGRTSDPPSHGPRPSPGNGQSPAHPFPPTWKEEDKPQQGTGFFSHLLEGSTSLIISLFP